MKLWNCVCPESELLLTSKHRNGHPRASKGGLGQCRRSQIWIFGIGTARWSILYSGTWTWHFYKLKMHRMLHTIYRSPLCARSKSIEKIFSCLFKPLIVYSSLIFWQKLHFCVGFFLCPSVEPLCKVCLQECQNKKPMQRLLFIKYKEEFVAIFNDSHPC